MQRLRALAIRLFRHNTVQNALYLYAVQFATYAFPLITVPYLSRILNPEKFGLVVYGQAFMWYFIAISEWGFNITATRDIAVHRDDSRKVEEVFSAVVWSKAILTVLGFAIMMGSVFAIPKLRAEWPLFAISFLTVIGTALFPMWLYQGLEKMRHVAIRDFVGKLLATVLIFIVVRQESDYLLAAAVQSGAGVITGAISLAAVPLLFGIHLRKPNRSDMVRALRVGWPVFLSMAALSVLSTTNVMILGLVASAAELGYFMAASRLIVALRMLVGPMVTALYPHISRMAARSGAEAIQFLRKYALVVSAPFLLLSLTLFVAAPLVVRILFGEHYIATTPILRIMALSPFLLSLSHAFTTYFMLPFGYDKQWTRIVMQSTALNFVVIGPALLLLRPGIALAVVSLIVDLFVVGVGYWFYRKQSRVHDSHPVAA